MFKVPENYRSKFGIMASDKSYGNNGVFIIPINHVESLNCIASCGFGWDHVSVCKNRNNQSITPTWNEMCKIKNLFWDEEDCVVQFHPPKDQYVNMHPNVLHLWRKQDTNFETPPKILV